MRILILLVMLCGVAQAGTKRVAVVVGNNTGNAGLQPLRYAEADAAKVGRVLVELGGVAQSDLFLLQGKDVATLETTLARAKTKVTEYQRTDRVVLLFYYSGHSDGLALELGRDRFTFAALRKWLKDTGAEVRVGFIDSCKSGALIATKGGTPGPSFQIRLTDDLASTGEALLTSSAADENALESKEIGGSFFTHHLVSGLRGAADASGDARVTLNEAYQYAYKHTLSTSGATLAGPQHPAYEIALSGQGELILTELAEQSAALALPEGFERALVIDAAHDQVIAELGPGAPPQLAVTPGRYGVRAWKRDRVYEGRVTVAAHAMHAVRWDELQPVTLSATLAKGGIASTPIVLDVGFGPRGAVADRIGAVPSVRIGVRRARWSLALDLGSWEMQNVRETTALALAGFRFETQTGRVHAWAGVEAGGGLIRQSLDETTGSSGAAAAGPSIGLAVDVTHAVQVALTGQLLGALVQEDGLSVVALPGAWLGVGVSL
jgi:hypothetical protein